MNFNLTKPCADCPFRTDKHFPLNAERAEDIAHGLTVQQGTFACHKTIDYSGDDPEHVKKTEHCAGALIMLEHMQQPNQMMRWMERINAYDHTKLDMEQPVFDNADDFVESMGGAL